MLFHRDNNNITISDWWENWSDRLTNNTVGRPAMSDDPHKPYWPKPNHDPKDGPVRSLNWRQTWDLCPKAVAMRAMGATPEELDAAFAEWFKGYNR